MKISYFFTIISIILTSWLLAHLLAIFGLLLAFLYPIWWLTSPRKAICFLCRAKRVGDWCPFCRQKIPSADRYLIKTGTSAVLNSLLILLVSLLAILLVVIEGQLLFKIGWPPTPKTVSFSIPAKGQYQLGEIFPVKLEVTGIQQPINAVQVDLGFDPQKLELLEISTEESFATIFIQKEINNSAGWGRLTGGLPNPGYTKNSGIFGTAFFKAKSPGLAKIEFLPSSLVLANDSRGTNVLHQLSSISCLILPEKISKEKEKIQENLILSSLVLGETTTSTQLKFYEEQPFLGKAISKEIEEEKQFRPGKNIASLVEKLDEFILTWWHQILSAWVF